MKTMRHGRPDAGYSLMEVTVVLAITTVVLVMAMQMMEAAVQASLFVESHNDLTIMAQRPLNVMHTDVVQSRAVFSGNTTGLSYQTVMEANLPAPGPATHLMPVVDPANAFAPDTPGGTRYTGTCLLLVKQLPPLNITIGGTVGAVRITNGGSAYTSAPTVTILGGGGSGAAATATISGGRVVSVAVTNDGINYTSAPTVSFSGGGGSGATATMSLASFDADRYVFEYFYQINNTGRPFSKALFYNSPDRYIDLLRARSEIFANYNQLVTDTADLTATQKTNIASGLRSAGLATCQSQTRDINDSSGFSDCTVMKAWDFNAATAAAGIYDVSSTLVLATPTTVAMTIRRVNTLLPELRGGRISGRMDYSVATGTGSFVNAFPLRDAVPTYLDPATEPGYSGFELKLTGRAGRQMVLMRLVMMSYYGLDKFDSEDGFVITSIPGTIPGT